MLTIGDHCRLEFVFSVKNLDDNFINTDLHETHLYR